MSEQKSSSAKWLALIAATLAFTFTFISRFTWAPLMNTVMGEFNINAAQAGLYMTAFFIGYCITQLPGGIMADKLQPKVILIVCTLLAAVCTALMSTISGYTPGLILRIITGLCSGCVMASCSKIVTANFAPKERATAMGVLLASPPIGILLANQIAPRLLGVVGWRTTFVYMSLFAVLVILALVFFVKPVPKAAPASNKKAGLLEGLINYFKDPQQLMSHTGLHIGSGRIIHCSGEVKTDSISNRTWTHWAVPIGLYTEKEIKEARRIKAVSSLKRGSKGDAVRTLQENLNKLGYNCGSVDGKFGAATEKAVKLFQSDHGLTVDGIAGSLTQAALEETLGNGGAVEKKLTLEERIEKLEKAVFGA